MKVKILFAGFLSLSLWASQDAYALGRWVAVTVKSFNPCTSVSCPPSGGIEVELSGTATNGASCGSSFPYWVVVDVSTPIGQLIAQVLEQARSNGNTVNVGGAGTCDIVTGIETAAWVAE